MKGCKSIKNKCCKEIVSTDCVEYEDKSIYKTLTKVIKDIYKKISNVEEQVSEPIAIQNIGVGVEVFSGVDTGVYQLKTFKTDNLEISGTPENITINNSNRGLVYTAQVSGLHNIPHTIYKQYNYTLIGNTTLLPPTILGTESVEYKMYITGSYNLNFPSWIKSKIGNDTYNGAIGNEVIITIVRGGVSPIGYYELKNI